MFSANIAELNSGEERTIIAARANFATRPSKILFSMYASGPIEGFLSWYVRAKACPEIVDASAMALATSDLQGRPSVRMVLLKHCDEQGFVFYTNLESPKAEDLRNNPQASLCFHWAALRRQVRIHGKVLPVAASEADDYFMTRPRLSQLAAWASKQSRPMSNRFELEFAVTKTAARFAVGSVPRPEHWSGFRVVPDEIEFWEEGSFRRHERWRYRWSEAHWEKEQLFP